MNTARQIFPPRYGDHTWAVHLLGQHYQGATSPAKADFKGKDGCREIEGSPTAIQLLSARILRFLISRLIVFYSTWLPLQVKQVPGFLLLVL